MLKKILATVGVMLHSFIATTIPCEFEKARINLTKKEEAT
jgi:hypothetical protein